MDKELAKTLKYLRLGGLLAHWDQYLELSEREQFSPVRLLQHVLEEERKIKQENALKLRLKRAQIREHLVMETYPFHRQPNLDRQRILSIYDAFDFVERARNIIWIGPPGVGKSGLATSFLIHAIERGHTGRYIKFPELITELYASQADHSTPKVIKHFLRYDVLLVDEIGYVEMEPSWIGHFFTLMDKRYKRKPTLITSNLGFSEWQSFLKNGHLTGALIDRLTDNSSHVISMRSCISIRSNPDEIQELSDYPREPKAAAEGQ